MEAIKLKIEHPDHCKMVLTNERGDTYATDSEQLMDFLCGLESYSLEPNNVPSVEIIDDWLKSEAPYNITGKHINQWLLSRLKEQEGRKYNCHEWVDYEGDFLKEQCSICKGIRLKGARLDNKIEYPPEGKTNK